MQNWETALEDLNRLKDVIESNVSFVNSYQSVALLYKIDLTLAINSLYEMQLQGIVFIIRAVSKGCNL